MKAMIKAEKKGSCSLWSCSAYVNGGFRYVGHPREYSPTLVDGKAVQVDTIITVNYTLDSAPY